MLKNFKLQILIVILLATLIGIFLTFREKLFTPSKANLTTPLSQTQNSATKSVPNPLASPKFNEGGSPTPKPIDFNTNLEQFTQSLTPEDFSPDFQNLKNQVAHF